MPADLDKLHNGILKALRQRYPRRDEKELDAMAWAMAIKRFNDMKKKESYISLDNKEDSHMTDFKQQAENTDDIVKENITKKNKIKKDEQGNIIVAEHVPIIINTFIYAQGE